MELVHSNPALFTGSRIGEDFRLTELLGSVIAYAGYGLILARRDRRIIYANALAKRLLRASKGLRSDQGVLCTADFDSSRQLQSLILAASRKTGEPAQGESMIIRDEDGVAVFVLHSVLLSQSPVEAATRGKGDAVGLLIFDCQTGISDRVKVFSELFSLTTAEMRVLALLLLGGSVNHAAAQLNIAQSTAQTHMKRILDKTGTHRQAELVKIFYEVTIPWPGRESATPGRFTPWRAVWDHDAAGEGARPRSGGTAG